MFGWIYAGVKVFGAINWVGSEMYEDGEIRVNISLSRNDPKKRKHSTWFMRLVNKS
jgi:hypothetical protein